MSILPGLTDVVSFQLPVQNVPDPGPVPLPGGLGATANTAIGMVKTVLIVAGVVALMVCAGMIMLGRRNRNQVATEGLLGIPYVIGALGLVGSAAAIVGTFL